VLSNYARGLGALFTFMVLVTTSVCIIFYVVGILASFRLVRNGRIASSSGFATIAATGLLYSLWTFYGAGLEAGLWSVAMTAAGLPVYVFMKRRQASKLPTRASRSER
jgi:basic amino acid/polyamine antiporter, APA family